MFELESIDIDETNPNEYRECYGGFGGYRLHAAEGSRYKFAVSFKATSQEAYEFGRCLHELLAKFAGLEHEPSTPSTAIALPEHGEAGSAAETGGEQSKACPVSPDEMLLLAQARARRGGD